MGSELVEGVEPPEEEPLSFFLKVFLTRSRSPILKSRYFGLCTRRVKCPKSGDGSECCWTTIGYGRIRKRQRERGKTREQELLFLSRFRQVDRCTIDVMRCRHSEEWKRMAITGEGGSEIMVRTANGTTTINSYEQSIRFG